MVGEGGCRLREGENERQVSVAGAEKMSLSVVTHGAGERSRCQNLEGLTCHTGHLGFLRSVLFNVLICDVVRSPWQHVYQHSASFMENVSL